jgi:hypothetical protein
MNTGLLKPAVIQIRISFDLRFENPQQIQSDSWKNFFENVDESNEFHAFEACLYFPNMTFQ